MNMTANIVQPWERDPDAVAYEFMTAGGANTPEQVDYLLADQDADSLTNEASANWTLHVSKDDLRAAIARFIETRPDREA